MRSLRPASGVPSIGFRKLTGIDSHAQIAQRDGHVDDVAPALAHADDAAGAQLHAGVAHGAQRGEAVGERVRRADLAVVTLARVEVVIHAVDAARLQLAGLLGREQAQAGADLQVVALLDLRHDRA